MKKFLILFWLSTTAGLIAPVQATEFRLDTTLLGQVRENEDNRTELPLNGYLGAGLRQGEWTGWSSMRLFRDLDRKVDDYDLYQALLEFRPVEPLQVRFGRQFLSEGFSAEILDGLRTRIEPGPLSITLYGGIPRTVERGDFNKNDGLLSGISIGNKEAAKLQTRLHAAWRKNDWGSADLRQNDEVRVGADLSHRWETGTRLYGLAEYDASSRILDSGTAGIEASPHPRFSFTVEGNYFNTSRETSIPTILSLLTRGETISGRFSSSVTLIPGLLDLEEGYSYQTVEIQDGVRRKGHLLEAGFPFVLETIGLFVRPAYYFSNSFGGTVHGVRGSVNEEWTERLSTELGIDFATYQKITNDNDQAFSTVLWTGYEVVKGWTLAAGFEYNRNNLFNRDVRGSFKLEYHYGKI